MFGLFAGAAGLPRVEIHEEGPDLVVRLPVPGLDPESLEVRLAARALYLRGEGRRAYREERADWFLSAASWGSFSTVVPLPAAVDPARGRALLRDGVLEVRAPRVPIPPVSPA